MKSWRSEYSIGKEITKEEAFEVIRKCEEAGLVHLVDNARKHQTTFSASAAAVARYDQPEEDFKGSSDGNLFSQRHRS